MIAHTKPVSREKAYKRQTLSPSRGFRQPPLRHRLLARAAAFLHRTEPPFDISGNFTGYPQGYAAVAVDNQIRRELLPSGAIYGFPIDLSQTIVEDELIETTV
nr:hypothetical protein [Chromobacterium sp. ASV5]